LCFHYAGKKRKIRKIIESLGHTNWAGKTFTVARDIVSGLKEGAAFARARSGCPVRLST